MVAPRTSRAWTLWLQVDPARKPQHRGTQATLTEAHRFFAAVCRWVREGVYPVKSGTLWLEGPEHDRLAELDIATGQAHWHAPRTAALHVEREREAVE